MLRQRVEALQRKFLEGKSGGRAELVLFEDALAHLTRLTRMFAMDRASALLVGVGGSGKQSLARLAAYIAGACTLSACEQGCVCACMHVGMFVCSFACACVHMPLWHAIMLPWLWWGRQGYVI